MGNFRQLSFSSGEIAPALYGRVDHIKYATGLKTLVNFLVMRHGGVENRAGTGWIGEVKDSTKKVRQIPFIFNSEQTYVLELGNQYMRVMRQGAYVMEAAQSVNMAGITRANPCIIGVNAHGFSNGDEIHVTSVKGMTQANNRFFTVFNPGINSFSIKYKDGTVVDSTSFNAYLS